MENKELTARQSLELIERMIATTRRNFNDRGGAMFLIWGYTAVAVTLAVTGLLLATHNNPEIHWLWWAIPVVGGVLTWRHFGKHEKTVRTHLDKAVEAVWAVMFGAVVCCMVTSFVTPIVADKSYIDVLFTICLIICMGTAITGRMIKFRPVAIGGFIGMGLSFALLPLVGSIWQLPMFAAVFLVAQVIPGHLLDAACKRERVAAEASSASAAKNGRAE